MNPVNLADGAVVKNLLGLALFVFLIASTPLVIMILLRIFRETKIRGPALAGTAHFLSLEQTEVVPGFVEFEVAVPHLRPA